MVSLPEFRRRLEEYRRAADEQAQALKDSYFTLEELYKLYERCDGDERVMADEVIRSWVLAEDAGLRFDGVALVNHFRIVSAVAALRELAARLELSSDTGASVERDSVLRVADDLASR